MNAKFLILLLLLPSSIFAQGYAGLGEQQHGFTEVTPGHEFSFPADHGPHEDFRIEWWYVTANLKSEDGQEYGIQWTLFRQATRPGKGSGWQSNQIWMGHAALTSATQHAFAEKFARGGIGQAGALAEPFEAWIDDWQMKGRFDNLSLSASGDDFSYQLHLRSDAPLVLHGDNGFSVKSQTGQASYYYSQPSYQVTGSLFENGEQIAVTGAAWLDREWSTQPLAANQEGWDWLSLHLESGEKVMLFRLRGNEGDDFYSGTWISASGQAEPLSNGEIELEPLHESWVQGIDIPTKWQVRVPGKSLDVTIGAINPQSYMHTVFPYWEGPVTLSGSHKGQGYLEMTGY